MHLQLVAGCHLCPLDKSELNSLNHSKSNWNPAATGKSQTRAVVHPNASEPVTLESCETPQHFYARWKALSLSKNCDEKEKAMQLSYLVFGQKSSVLRDLFDSGLGATLLPEVLSAFTGVTEAQPFSESVDNQLVQNILSTLLAFSESKQFSLAVDLCSDAEKEMALSLLRRFSTSCGVESLKTYFQ